MKKYALSFIAACALFTGILYPLLWWTSLGRYERAEHWLKPVFDIKLHTAQQLAEPKIVVLSGSNGLFGLDSHRLAEVLGREVLNLSGHASLTLEFLTDQAGQATQPGDIIVMPLEFDYYRSQRELTTWQVANMSSWGADHVKYYDLSETLRYFKYSSPFAVIRRVFVSFFRGLPDTPLDEALTAALSRSQSGDNGWNGYSYLSLNHLGDILIDEPPTDRLRSIQNEQSYLGRSRPSEAFLDSFRALKSAMAAQGVEVFLTWPTTLQNKRFDLEQDQHAEKVEALRRNLKEAGIDVICDARAFHYSIEYFFDTHYHLNHDGARQRAEALADCLAEEVFGT